MPFWVHGRDATTGEPGQMLSDAATPEAAREQARKGAKPEAALKGHRNAVFSADGRRVKTPIYDGTPLGVGAKIKGPAVIEEVTTTIVVEPGWTAVLDESGSYLITRDRKGGR